jgi:RNase P protein component
MRNPIKRLCQITKGAKRVPNNNIQKDVILIPAEQIEKCSIDTPLEKIASD